MKDENKEMQLLTGLGRLMVKYMDYVALLFIFPIIFDVKTFDPKVFIALGTLIVIRAIMPMAHYIMGIGIKEKEKPVQLQPETKKPETQLHKTEEPVPEDTIYRSTIDTTQLQRTEMKFPGKGEKPVEINTKKTDEEFLLIKFPDFRTLKLHKTEVEQAAISLLESYCGFFKNGKWNLEIKAKKE